MATPTTRQLENRLTDLEGAIADESAQRDQQIASLDEELELHQEEIARLFAGCRRIVRRMGQLSRSVKELRQK